MLECVTLGRGVCVCVCPNVHVLHACMYMCTRVCVFLRECGKV